MKWLFIILESVEGAWSQKITIEGMQINHDCLPVLDMRMNLNTGMYVKQQCF